MTARSNSGDAPHARFSAEEWDSRVELAAATASSSLGWTELIYNHISLRVARGRGRTS